MTAGCLPPAHYVLFVLASLVSRNYVFRLVEAIEMTFGIFSERIRETARLASLLDQNPRRRVHMPPHGGGKTSDILSVAYR